MALKPLLLLLLSFTLTGQLALSMPAANVPAPAIPGEPSETPSVMPSPPPSEPRINTTFSRSFNSIFDGSRKGWNQKLYELKPSKDLNPPLFTISALVQPSGVDQSDEAVIVSRDLAPISGYGLYRHGKDAFLCEAAFPTFDQFLFVRVIGDPGTAIPETWSFVACTYDGKFLSLYVNGSFVRAKEMADFLPNVNASTRIAAGKTESQTDPQYFFVGSIGFVEIRDGALTKEAMAVAYQYAMKLVPDDIKAGVVVNSRTTGLVLGLILTFLFIGLLLYLYYRQKQKRASLNPTLIPASSLSNSQQIVGEHVSKFTKSRAKPATILEEPPSHTRQPKSILKYPKKERREEEQPLMAMQDFSDPTTLSSDRQTTPDLKLRKVPQTAPSTVQQPRRGPLPEPSEPPEPDYRAQEPDIYHQSGAVMLESTRKSEPLEYQPPNFLETRESSKISSLWGDSEGKTLTSRKTDQAHAPEELMQHKIVSEINEQLSASDRFESFPQLTNSQAENGDNRLVSFSDEFVGSFSSPQGTSAALMEEKEETNISQNTDGPELTPLQKAEAALAEADAVLPHKLDQSAKLTPLQKAQAALSEADAVLHGQEVQEPELIEAQAQPVDESQEETTEIVAEVSTEQFDAALKDLELASQEIVAYDPSLQNDGSSDAKEIVAVDEPVVDGPAVDEPVIESQSVNELAVEDTAVEDSAVEDPAVEDPAVEDPAVEDPAAVKPAVEEPVVEEPAVEAPRMEEPRVADPVEEELAAEAPAVDESNLRERELRESSQVIVDVNQEVNDGDVSQENPHASDQDLPDFADEDAEISA